MNASISYNLKPLCVYFSRFGPVAWCLQASDEFSFMLSFCDPSAYSVVLEFNHFVAKRPVQIRAMKNGRLPVRLKKGK